MGRGGGEGRVPSLMTAAVEREVSNSYFFSFFFDMQKSLNSDLVGSHLNPLSKAPSFQHYQIL